MSRCGPNGRGKHLQDLREMTVHRHTALGSRECVDRRTQTRGVRGPDGLGIRGWVVLGASINGTEEGERVAVTDGVGEVGCAVLATEMCERCAFKGRGRSGRGSKRSFLVPPNLANKQSEGRDNALVGFRARNRGDVVLRLEGQWALCRRTRCPD